MTTTTTTESTSSSNLSPSATPEVLVSLGDAMLYEGDMKLLRGTGWLNDHCVLFWQQYLETKLFPESKESSSLMLQPAAAFSMQFLDDEDLLADTPDNIFRQLSKANLVLVPIVDADAEEGGGSHWTLIAVHRGDGYYHFDSSLNAAGGEVLEAAKVTAARLSSLFSDASIDPAEIKPVPCPQQNNGYDCGVFACAFAEKIMSAYLGHLKSTEADSSAKPSFKLQDVFPHLPSDMEIKREQMW
eukprot:CAMPEP_0171552316 /NCGR_PEP_ID=MMETSP0960-20121227/8252_1 /TAXON_ID=87120 /ORGANISM="Aurantiochytrium limacinum, Strain ATCCMYA-1381" /LENGTH=242 /DNA_ID=CAMNT_0012101749 /DNA_START=217 /DNA_END=942 /DNA_ORIENTATION=+